VPPAKTLERVPRGEDRHEQDWIRAVRFLGRLLLRDGEPVKVTNDTEADASVRRQYREGWTL
jgi:hypothetical protein